ncbi:MAG: Ldh family oxidoreductase, partial [Pseudomonadota bacterium]
RRFAEENLIGIIGCNSVGLVAAPSGKDRILGTNPLGMAFPSADGNHFIGDIATSAIALGKVMVMKDKGEQVPEGKLIDENGNPSTNPDHAFFGTEGAILPMENYHGFSIALMITLLGGTLLGAKDIKMDIYDSDGFFMIGIDPKAFGLDNAPSAIQDTLNLIRSSAPAPGFEEVSLPGDRSSKTYEETLKNGIVGVAPKTLEKLRALA